MWTVFLYKKIKEVVGLLYDDVWGSLKQVEFQNESEWKDIHNIYGEIILLQYTGLHDKNGKEIYEGDIISVVGDKFVVLWVGCGFQFIDIWTNAKSIKSEEILEFYNKGVSIEVIGNIFENPNLLEK